METIIGVLSILLCLSQAHGFMLPQLGASYDMQASPASYFLRLRGGQGTSRLRMSKSVSVFAFVFDACAGHLTYVCRICSPQRWLISELYFFRLALCTCEPCQFDMHSVQDGLDEVGRVGDKVIASEVLFLILPGIYWIHFKCSPRFLSRVCLSVLMAVHMRTRNFG